MATQNPIEQEGTYALPEAQRDRFLLHANVDYPDKGAETEILRLVRRRRREGKAVSDLVVSKVSAETVFSARREVLGLHLAPDLERYLVQLVVATRDPKPFDPELADWIRYGASPRGTIALDLAARAHAWLEGREYVSPDDIHALAPDVLRHRILLSYEAEADGISPDRVVQRLLAAVAIP
jgi:MoxR-like ATPase